MLNQIKHTFSKALASLLTHPKPFIVKPDQQFVRRSSLSLEKMVSAILGMGGKTLSKELLDLKLDVTNSAFVQRRYQIKSDLFKSLFDSFTDRIPNHIDLPILAIDGSDVSIPRNDQDHETCIIANVGSKPYNLIQLNALFDLKRNIYVDACVQDKRQVNENDGLIQLMSASSFDKALIIMDRGYESYNVIAHCQERGWSYLIRIKDGSYGIKGKVNSPASPCFDQTFHLILCRKQTKDWKQVYQQFPNHFRFLPKTSRFDFLSEKSRTQDIQTYFLGFRMVRLEVAPGSYETLITNTDYPIEQLKSLYARLINFNFCQWLASQVIINKSGRTYDYQICFSDAAYASRLFFIGVLSSPKVEAYLKKHLTPVRPKRSFERRLHPQTVVSFAYRVS